MANSNLCTILSSASRDYVVDNKEAQIKVSELANTKVVGLYFSAHWCPPCRRFTPDLVKAYNEMKKQGKEIEIIFVSGDTDEKAFNEYFREMPWLALPYQDRETEQNLSKKYDVEGIPTLIILDGNGTTITNDGRTFISLGGANAYPFSQEKLAQLMKIQEDKRKEAERKLEELKNEVAEKDGISILASNRDHLINNKGATVPISDVKKNQVVGLYFSAHWCGPCRHFTPQLAKIYEEMKSQGKEIEIVFISSDSDESSFTEYFKEMPWLALPFNERDNQKKLSIKYEIRGIPSLILLNGNGAILSSNGRALLTSYGASAFPFTEEKISELKKADEEKMKAFPKQVKDARHEHPLNLVPTVYAGSYGCDGCGNSGSGWVYHCDECQYDLHPACAKQEVV